MNHAPLLKNTVTCFFLVILMSISLSESLAQDSRKVIRKRERSSRIYDYFNYDKAIKNYKKVLKNKPDDEESILRIADSYRRMRKVEESREWYSKAEEQGIITEKEDAINYANVLSTLGEYKHAKKWYEEHGMEGALGDVVAAKVAALDNMEQFYKDTTVYFLENVPFNSEFSDFGPSYSHGGIVFTSGRRASTGLFKPKYNWDGGSFLELYYVENHHDTVKEIEGGINTRYHEGPAAFYDDDTQVIFTRNNYQKLVAGESYEGVNTLNLFSAERENPEDDWDNVKRLWFNTDDHSYGHPTITKDGKTMYFASDMESSIGGSDIYKTEWIDGKWSTPQNLGIAINTEGNEFFPFVHEEGLLYFASDGLQGIGGLDIYQIDLKDSTAKPQNLGAPINTSLDDFGMIVDSVGMTGYLASNRTGGKGHDDIYYFEKYEYEVKVVLVDAKTDQPITGALSSVFQDVWSKEQHLESDQELNYKIIKGRHMQLSGSAVGYQPKDTLATASLLDSATRLMEIHVPLIENKGVTKDIIVVVNNKVPTQLFVKGPELLEVFDGDISALKQSLEEDGITIGETFTYENIYYDFDKSFIRSDASKELDEIIGLLNQYPDLKIKLGSHTDIRGSHDYNKGLAKRRAKSVRKYLMDADIDKDRISTGSFGEEKLHIDCAPNCDEVKHQSNRRTEIKLYYLLTNLFTKLIEKP